MPVSVISDMSPPSEASMSEKSVPESVVMAITSQSVVVDIVQAVVARIVVDSTARYGIGHRKKDESDQYHEDQLRKQTRPA
jgi:hypothetical protein